jgi:redox-sensitive bicupin YhaK (pirin superfamily)
MMKVTTFRKLKQIITGNKVTDGDGVQLTRIIGSRNLSMLDPFLLLDSFETEKPEDYIGGFPAHPHRGFETVTYLLEGRMRHKDNAGNEGVIEPGGVQWMTAGSGIVHSEIPEQERGLLHGFQLWVNLPARAKMTAPAYQEFPAEQITREQLGNGGEVRVISGKTNQGTVGPIVNEYVSPLYLDVSLSEGQVFEQAVADDANAFVYVIEGELAVGKQADRIDTRQLGILENGSSIQLKANKQARFLVASAIPLNEPVVRGGPFVMNTKQQLEQAFSDYG